MQKKKKGQQPEDLSQRKFGKLLAVEAVGRIGNSRHYFWKCRCDCGGEHIVSTQHLKTGQVKKCKACPLKTDKELLEEAIERFNQNIEKKGSCWIWKGIIVKSYGMMFYKKPIKSHRFSYMLFNGQLDPNKFICHTCDNPLCVNPDHLFQGSSKENTQDASKKGRLLSGEKSHYSKLTEEEVIDILTSKEKGVTLASRYGVDKNTISNIRRRKSWKNINMPSGGIYGRF